MTTTGSRTHAERRAAALEVFERFTNGEVDAERAQRSMTRRLGALGTFAFDVVMGGRVVADAAVATRPQPHRHHRACHHRLQRRAVAACRSRAEPRPSAHRDRGDLDPGGRLRRISDGHGGIAGRRRPVPGRSTASSGCPSVRVAPNLTTTSGSDVRSRCARHSRRAVLRATRRRTWHASSNTSAKSGASPITGRSGISGHDKSCRGAIAAWWSSQS